MFICKPCSESAGVTGLLRSWGNCELCHNSGTYCFDIPAKFLPVDRREEVCARVIEELFALARERRLLLDTHEADELTCHLEELVSAIAVISPSMLREVTRELVVMLDQVSYDNGLITKGR
jgi:hypothetical protein